MKSTRILSSSIVTLLALAVARQAYGQAISISGPTTYTENFDILGTSTVLWNDGLTLPGWYAGINANATADGNLQISNGSEGALVGLLNLGSAGSIDRALGSKSTSTNGFANVGYGVLFQNTSANPLRILNIGYTGELWRTNGGGAPGVAERWETFYKISPTEFTDVEPGGSGAGPNVGSFVNFDGLDWASPTNVPAGGQLDGNLDANRTVLGANPNLTLQPGEFFMFRWIDTNLANTDGFQGIDDFSITFLPFVTPTGRSIVYNTAHTVGGAPSGVLTVSADPYWTNLGSPTGFQFGDSVIFETDVAVGTTVNIDVPTAVIVDTMVVSANTGTYSIGGLGGITGNLIKSGNGGLVLVGSNSFGTTTLNDNGTIVSQDLNSFSTNDLILTTGGTLDVIGSAAVTGVISGDGGLTKTGNGLLRLAGGVSPNSYGGTTTVNGGSVVLSKNAGTTTIPGDLVIGAGATVRYTGNNTGDQIADTATITMNGGTFGDVVAGNPTNPGAPETVAAVVMNGGQLSTGRAVFTTTGNFTINAGTATSHRGGTLSVGNTLTVGGILELHGGSTTVGQESRATTGAGGLVLNNGAIRFNTGTTLALDSMGSIVSLGGNVVSTGNSVLSRENSAVGTAPKSDLDLQGIERTFDVTGSLRIGTLADPILVQNGGIVKTGTGVLSLGGLQPYTQPTTINAGKLEFHGSLASGTIAVNAGGTLGGVGSALGVVTVNNGGAIEAGVNGQGALILAGLTLGSTATDTASITLTRNLDPAIVSVSNLVVNGGANSVVLNLAGAGVGVGQHVLIDYDTIGGPGGFGAFTIGTLPNRTTAALYNDGSVIGLEVVAVDQPVWSGKNSSEWSIANIAGEKNWVLSSNSALTTDFLTNDNVLFNDSADNKTVNIGPDDVTPASVRFANNTSYTITGSKGIAGLTGLVMDGQGVVTIQNVNSFVGPVVLNGGVVEVASLADAGVNSALGAGGSIAFNGGALAITGAVSSTNRTWNVDGLGGSVNSAGSVTMSGALTGQAILNKVGTGKLILTGASPNFDGTINILQGSLQYTGQSLGGDATHQVDVNIDAGAILENNDVVEAVFNDAAAIGRTLNIGIGGGTVSVLNAAGAILFDKLGGITGNGTITKTGPGIMRPHVDNATFLGNWILNEGTLEVGSLGALGPNATVTVNGGLLASRNVSVPNAVTVNGGTIGTRSGDLADFQGTFTLAGPMTVDLKSYTTPANSQTITLSGPVEGNGNISVIGNSPQTNGGNKALIFTNVNNSFSGTISVAPGQIVTSQPLASGSTLGTATVSLTDAGFNILDNGPADGGLINYNTPVIVGGAATSTINVDRGATGAFTGNTVRLGTLSIGAQTLSVTGGNSYKASFSGTTTLTGAANFQPSTADLLFEGNITGTAGFTKSGTGRMVISGPTTFTGPVTVQAGTLAVNGSTSAGSDYTVQGGTLAGIGTIDGNVNVAGGALAPGDGVGILKVQGNVTFAAGSVFNLQLSGGVGPQPDPLTDYGQLNVGLSAASTISLNGATLALNVGADILENDLFFVLLNSGADTISGTFAGLSDDAIFLAGGQVFQISYNADSTAGTFNAVGGNDIALMAIPEPGSLLLLGGGLMLLSGRRRRQA